MNNISENPGLPKFFASVKESYGINGLERSDILAFAGNNINSFVKELTQNSLDARLTDKDGKLVDGVLKLNVQLITVQKSEIPDFNNLENMLECMKKTQLSRNNNYLEFFNNINRDCIGVRGFKVLTFEDYNTTGCSETKFSALADDEGISDKDQFDSIGRNGIGKNAVFGFSTICSVVYHSLNKSGERKFKGVTKLGTFVDTEGIQRESKIFYGDIVNNKAVKYISDESYIPDIFKRDEVGLSTFVLCAKAGKDWKEMVIKAFVDNYWMLFEDNKLFVKVGVEEINKSNYYDKVKEIYKDLSQTVRNHGPLPYIEALRNGKEYITEDIPKLGKFHIHFYEQTNSSDFQCFNRKLFLRGGMEITKESIRSGSSPNKLSVIMYCSDKTGNKILGDMEDPSHSKFIPERLENRNIDCSPLEGREILNQINDFFDSSLENFLEKYNIETSTVDWLDDLFSIDLGDIGGSGSGRTKHSEKEKFNSTSYKKRESVIFNSSTSRASSTFDDSGSEEDVDAQGHKRIGPPRPLPVPPIPEPDPKPKPGDKFRKKVAKRKEKIESRVFNLSINPKTNKNIYKIYLQSDQDVSGDFQLYQFGDSGRSDMSARLLSVKDCKTNRPVKFTENRNSSDDIINYTLHEIELNANERISFEMEIEEPFLSAFLINL